MRRLLTMVAALVLLSGTGGCKHIAGRCDCDCCGYGCCGDYGCFECCPGCGCVDPPPVIPHAGGPGVGFEPIPGPGGDHPVTYYPAQPTYPSEYVAPAPRTVVPSGT